MSWLADVWRRIRHVQEPPPRPSDLIHYSPDLTPYPICGERLGAPWASNMEAVTCHKCREIGIPLIIQYEISTR